MVTLYVHPPPPPPPPPPLSLTFIHVFRHPSRTLLLLFLLPPPPLFMAKWPADKLLTPLERQRRKEDYYLRRESEPVGVTDHQSSKIKCFWKKYLILTSLVATCHFVLIQLFGRGCFHPASGRTALPHNRSMNV